MKKSYVIFGIIGSVLLLYTAVSLYLYKKSLTSDKMFSDNKVKYIYVLCYQNQEDCGEVYHAMSHFYYGKYALQMYIGLDGDVAISEDDNAIKILSDGKIECIKSENFCKQFEEDYKKFSKYHHHEK